MLIASFSVLEQLLLQALLAGAWMYPNWRRLGASISASVWLALSVVILEAVTGTSLSNFLIVALIATYVNAWIAYPWENDRVEQQPRHARRTAGDTKQTAAVTRIRLR